MPVDPVPLLFFWGYLLAGGISGGFAIYVLRYRWSEPTARAFGVVSFLLAVWSLAYVGRMLSPTLASKLLWTQLAWVGVAFTPVAVLVFVLHFTGRGRLITRRRLATLCVVPLLTQILLLTNDYHWLFYEDVWLYTGDSTPFIASRGGTWFYGVHIPYSWTLFLIATVLLVQFAFVTTHIYRTQVIALVFGATVPWFVNGTFLAGVRLHPELDPTPVGIAVGMGAIAIAVYRVDFLGLIPIAREEVLDEMDDCVFVIDGAARVIDSNASGQELIEVHGEDSWTAGATVEEIFPAAMRESIADPAAEADGVECELSCGGQSVWYLIRRREFGGLRYAGTIVTLTDISEQKRQQLAVERKNEQLDAVAKVLSHDLRNPLSVASGRIELARAEVENKHLEDAEVALARMEELLDDVLVMARGSQPSDSREAISIEQVGAAAWENVETGEATLQQSGEGIIRADESRLKQLLENLFGNAVEHGGDVAVTVGVLPDQDGFFVEDTGPGIPVGRREVVFEPRYSTREEGTGFGLAIVRSIAEEHGWSVGATTGEHGGARFVVTGVDLQAVQTVPRRTGD